MDVNSSGVSLMEILPIDGNILGLLVLGGVLSVSWAIIVTAFRIIFNLTKTSNKTSEKSDDTEKEKTYSD